MADNFRCFRGDAKEEALEEEAEDLRTRDPEETAERGGEARGEGRRDREQREERMAMLLLARDKT